VDHRAAEADLVDHRAAAGQPASSGRKRRQVVLGKLRGLHRLAAVAEDTSDYFVAAVEDSPAADTAVAADNAVVADTADTAAADTAAAAADTAAAAVDTAAVAAIHVVAAAGNSAADTADTAADTAVVADPLDREGFASWRHSVGRKADTTKRDCSFFRNAPTKGVHGICWYLLR